MIKLIPPLLVASRIGIALIILWSAKEAKISRWFLPLLLYAFFSDFLDGFICRKFAFESIALTMWDGYADSLLYLSSFLYLCRIHPELIRKYRVPLLFLLVLQIVSWGFSLIKFGKITSYHTYAVKFWGVLILISLVESFVTKKGIFLLAMVIVGSLCLFEDIAITAVMPYWKCSIKDIQTAVALKNKHLISSFRGSHRLQ